MPDRPIANAMASAMAPAIANPLANAMANRWRCDSTSTGTGTDYFYRNFCLLKRLPPSLRSVAHEPPAGQTLGARTTKTKNVTTDRARGNQRGARNNRQEKP